MKIIQGLIIGAVALASNAAIAQKNNWKDTSKLVFPSMKYKLNASGSHYIKGSMVAQMWLRTSEMNPGTTIFDTKTSHYSDIGIRRLRMSVWGQLTDRVFFYTQFGENNFNFLAKRNVNSYFHDAITEFKVAPQLSIGVGLTGWSGLARFASPSVGSIMGIDAPLYQQATNGVTDQFLRKLSIYAKGQIGKLDYRLAITSPMAAQNSLVTIPAISTESNFSMAAPKMQTQGYVFWQFMDKEDNTLPYTVGTYLGKKKVLNVGAGFINQQDAMWHLNSTNDTVSTAMTLISADVFLDMPVDKKGSAVSAYVAATHYDFGHNYLRNNNPMNPGTGVVPGQGSLNGAGIGFPMIGTGQTFYGQFGYKFRDGFVNKTGTIMPYVTAQYSQFQKLSDPMLMYSGGINWFIHGTHNAKLTLDYQNRPIFNQGIPGEYVKTARKGMLTLQYQISL